ncbi:hypothetical protein L3X38_020191 [Prunus dulcis]|uniref:Uncharacterized protein n=1 Tax=Prunus dulcis TaxID=3755 RepID=A0AAD4WEK9_PRUDU|nr:hypothetical protein L3X38_020191 [Prunus dulcis]
MSPARENKTDSSKSNTRHWHQQDKAGQTTVAVATTEITSLHSPSPPEEKGSTVTYDQRSLPRYAIKKILQHKHKLVQLAYQTLALNLTFPYVRYGAKGVDPLDVFEEHAVVVRRMNDEASIPVSDPLRSEG